MLNSKSMAGFIDPYSMDCVLDQDYKIILDAEDAENDKTR